MIPPLQPNGYLPTGILEATWQQVAERLATNSHRWTLLRSAQSLRQSRCRKLYLDGSFATDNERPADYEVA